MNKSLVSIIIPTKNSARTIQACLESCKDQTYQNIEIIVVDNFSTDGTFEIAKKYTDNVFQQWPERTAQKNYGIEKAQGEYLLIIDGDMSIDQELIEDCIHNITNHPMWWWVVIPVIDIWSSYWTQVIAFERSFYKWSSMEAARFLRKSLVDQVWWFKNIIFYEEFIVPQLIAQKWYDVKIYTHYNIYHDYDDFTFWWNLKKKFYYGKSLNEYKKQMNKLWIINVAAQQTNIFHRYYTFLKDKRFYQKPLLALWVLVLKTMEFGAWGLWMISSFYLYKLNSIMLYIKNYLINMYASAMNLNDCNVCKALIEFWSFERMLDVWCWDWEKTQSYIKSAWSIENYGIELVESEAKKANHLWIQTVACYADRDIWPFEDNFFDVVISNQVIEHLSDVDHFISEAYRVLKPWWYLVTSTNNLSSWHNIVALFFGRAPFDLTNSSKKAIGIGNPFAVHQGEVAEHWDSWTHKCIYTVKRLNDWFGKFWFKVVKNYGSWYYPLWAKVWSILKTHCAFITLVNKK